MPVRFTIPFIKQLLGVPLTTEDLRSVDPVLFEHKVEYIMRVESEEVLEALELCFEEEETMFGATKAIVKSC